MDETKVYSNTSKRQTWVDIMKGIAIVLVVFGHIINNTNDWGLVSKSSRILKALDDIIYGFHMPLFFFVAGFFVHKWEKKDVKGACIDKVLRFIEPYFVWVIVVSFIKYLTPSMQNNPGGLEKILRSPIVPFEQYWFLYVLFFIHMVYYAFAKKQLNHIYLVISIIGFLLEPILPDIWIIHDFFRYSIFFALGTYTVLCEFKDIIKKYGFAIILLFMIVNVLGGLVIKTVEVDLVSSYYLFFSACVGITFISYMSILLDNKGKGIAFLGKKSMEIYCIHPIIIGIVKVIVTRIGIEVLMFKVFIIWIVTMAICAVLFRIWDNRCPIYKTLYGGWGIKK